MTAPMSWPAMGERFGKRIVVDTGLIRVEASGRERPAVILLCEPCGNRDLVPVSAAKKTTTCARCADRGRSWTVDERRAHSERIKAGIEKARRRQAAADAKAVREMKARRRRRRMLAEAG